MGGLLPASNTFAARGAQDPTEKLNKGESEAHDEHSSTRAVSLQTSAV